jgi:peptide/nickel transport system substrate-binding protein
MFYYLLIEYVFRVAYDFFNQKFSPFFAKTAMDMDAQGMTQTVLMNIDREGNPVLKGIEGEKRSYNGKEYTYKGISDIEVVQNSDGTVDYNITLRKDIKFSDGEPLTIDDVIFNMYVLADPTYDGSSSFYTLPIEGLEEYRSSMIALSDLILKATPENTDFSKWTKEQQDKYWAAFNAAGEKFVQEIIDYCKANGLDAKNYYNNDVAMGMAEWGFGEINDKGVLTAPSGATFDLAAGKFPTAADYWNEIVKKYGYDVSDNGINHETAGTSISELISKELGNDADAFSAGVNVGEAIPSIKGIKKTGDYSATIHCTKFDATSIYQFNLPVAPLHYYGDKSLYNYEQNQFGFKKGDLSTVKSKTSKPMGAGPYKFVSYENGVITYEANEGYYDGKPKTKYVLFQETQEGDKLAGVASGSFDIAEPAFSASVAESIKKYNSNGDITGNVITTNTSDYLGYGYIGITAENVKVGTQRDSKESKDLRKAFATLFAVYRDTVVKSYYADAASVIQYPISNTSWAAPRPADEGYQIAYSVDVDGNPIYKDGMSEQERYDAALKAAIGYFKAAGYTFDEASGKFTAAPDGAKLSYEIIIPAGGEGNHPSYRILIAVKDALNKIGITLEINDPSDSNVLWNKLDAVPIQAEMWCAAWQATPDPDMYQVYHSSNINGAGGTESNHYYITDNTLDKLIMDARSSADQSFRKATYKQALDIILDWAVEVPIYQRQNAFVFSTERVNVNTITPDITPFWSWLNEIDKVEKN